VRIAKQLKLTREVRKEQLTQLQLAEKAGMTQSRISELEGMNYSSWSISTLERLGEALGVGFKYSWVEWSELVPEIEGGLSRAKLRVRSFEDDPAFAASGLVEVGSNQSAFRKTVARMLPAPISPTVLTQAANVIPLRKQRQQGNESKVDKTPLELAGGLSAEKAIA
jgi:transcriptional regulator with XRE-family HTH domain